MQWHLAMYRRLLAVQLRSQLQYRASFVLELHARFRLHPFDPSTARETHLSHVDAVFGKVAGEGQDEAPVTLTRIEIALGQYDDILLTVTLKSPVTTERGCAVLLSTSGENLPSPLPFSIKISLSGPLPV